MNCAINGFFIQWFTVALNTGDMDIVACIGQSFHLIFYPYIRREWMIQYEQYFHNNLSYEQIKTQNYEFIRNNALNSSIFPTKSFTSCEILIL